MPSNIQRKASDLVNIFTYDESDNVFIKNNSGGTSISISPTLNVGIGGSPNNINSLQISKANQWSAAFIGNLGGARTPSVAYGIHLGWNYTGGSSEANVIWGTGGGGPNPYLTFSSWNGTTKTDRMVLADTGKLTLPNYTSATSFTGTPVGYLGFDASGNILTTTGSGGGSITLSAIGSTPNANAATLTGSALNLEPASSSFGGIITTGTQTFGGAKTFNSTINVASTLTVNGIIINDFTLTGITGTSPSALPNSYIVNRFTFNSGISTSASVNTIGLDVDNQLNYSGANTINNTSYNTGGLFRNILSFGSAGTTITYSQATGIRALANNQVQYFQNGANSGTISHYANIQIFGDNKLSTGLTTFTNRYGLLINDYNEFSAGNTYTNRWAIYQNGASDNNYFKGKVVIGSTDTFGASPLNVKGLPTSSAGLATGDIWSNGGVLTVV